MYMVNFKKRFGISVILAALLLSGCQTKSESLPNNSTNISSAQPEESSSAPVESSVASSTQPVESSSAPVESSAVSLAQPEESSSLPEEPPPPFPADREYPDDELVPSDWLRVASQAEFADKINETLISDTSGKDPENAVAVLIDRNLLVHSFFFGGMELFEIDWDSPYDSPDFEEPIYPITSEYFSDVQSIYDLVYDTYKYSAAEDILHGWNGEPLLTEVNGRIYTNNTQFPKLGCTSFFTRSYVEITEKTENKCTFIWHFPNLDESEAGYIQPESGYEFFYHEKTYIAECIDGSWKLRDIVFDNGVF